MGWLDWLFGSAEDKYDAIHRGNVAKLYIGLEGTKGDESSMEYRYRVIGGKLKQAKGKNNLVTFLPITNKAVLVYIGYHGSTHPPNKDKIILYKNYKGKKKIICIP